LARKGGSVKLEDLYKLDATAKSGLYSQNNEDRVIDAIFEAIGTKGKFFVEIGVNAPRGRIECNTRKLKEDGWLGVWIDERCNLPEIENHHVCASNVNRIFAELEIPSTFDLLSIDIDGQDYWVWRELMAAARVVVIEYNRYLPINEPLSVPRDDDFVWRPKNRPRFFGAGLGAMMKLAHEKGYKLAYANHVNAFFVNDVDMTLTPEYDLKWVAKYIRPSGVSGMVSV
jgi:hypothetical protein